MYLIISKICTAPSQSDHPRTTVHCLWPMPQSNANRTYASAKVQSFLEKTKKDTEKTCIFQKKDFVFATQKEPIQDKSPNCFGKRPVKRSSFLYNNYPYCFVRRYLLARSGSLLKSSILSVRYLHFMMFTTYSYY